jgi:anhydro-N-acetylmuramic acid kinase
MSDHPLIRLSRKPALLVAGLMSGTSADGIDACLAEIREGDRGPVPRLIAHRTFDHDPELRALLLELGEVRAGGVPGPDRVEWVARANVALGEALGRAVRDIAAAAAVPLSSVDLIGSHGQTIRHLPAAGAIGALASRATLQIGEAAVIRELTGVPVVADFRVRDVAAGGLGAPLVPHVDRLLLSQPGKRRAAQNLGGIGNVTYLPDPSTSESLVAFDTGPANMVIDAVVRRITQGRETYDRDGARAARGTPARDLVEQIVAADAYHARKPPKTLGREEYGVAFVEDFVARCDARALSEDDRVATATWLTARATAESYRRWVLPRGLDELFVSGGGALNPTLLAMLAEAMPGVDVKTSAACGIPPLAKEALAFAVLAYELVHARPSNCPEATGAREPVVLGKLTL